LGGFGAERAHADGDLRQVQHIIIVMQENHSFDNRSYWIPGSWDLRIVYTDDISCHDP
jgi:hypothetical protein